MRGREFFIRGSFIVGDGQDIRFYEDTWLRDTPLSVQFPPLYSIVNNKNIHVADELANNPLNIRFRRVLQGEIWDSWLDLASRLINV
jgi:hypothetical protein